MEVKFWGTRGSIPVWLNSLEIRAKIHSVLEKAVNKGLEPGDDIDDYLDREIPFCERGTYGTNTSCVEIGDEDAFILCDAGTGIRSFGEHIMRLKPEKRPKEFHIFLSHLHWDHIQGFPFFIPALIPGNKVTLYGCHPDIEKAFRLQQSAPYFPLEFDRLGSETHFETLSPERTTEIAGFRVTPKQQNHPGMSFGYRFERAGKTVVYATDAEHKKEIEQGFSPFAAFFHQADLLIFDAQYTYAEACTVKEDWGHSNNVVAVEIALRAGVKHLVLFHQDPARSDAELDSLLDDTRKLAGLLGEKQDLKVTVAWDGLIVNI